MARGLKFQISERREIALHVSIKRKTKAQISCAVTVHLISALVFAYAKSRFSHDEAQTIKQTGFHYSKEVAYVTKYTSQETSML